MFQLSFKEFHQAAAVKFGRKFDFSIKIPSSKLQKLKNGLLPFCFVKQIDDVKVRSYRPTLNKI